MGRNYNLLALFAQNYLLCENCHVFQWQIKEENAGAKC